MRSTRLICCSALRSCITNGKLSLSFTNIHSSCHVFLSAPTYLRIEDVVNFLREAFHGVGRMRGNVGQVVNLRPIGNLPAGPQNISSCLDHGARMQDYPSCISGGTSGLISEAPPSA